MEEQKAAESAESNAVTAAPIQQPGLRIAGQPMQLHPKIAAHVFNVPLMAHPSLVATVLNAGANMLQPMASMEMEPEKEELEPTVTGPYIAHIRVEGPLVQDGNTFANACMGVTGYNEIQDAIEEARNGGAVGAILDVRSGGGEVAGCFDLVDYLYALRGSFKVYAIANDWAYSAAYAILSAAEKAFVTRTGGVGSIGVIAKWQSCYVSDMNYSGAVVEIVSGRFKNALSPHKEMLSDDGAAILQRMVNESARIFVETVARNRNISAEAVIALEATELFGQDAITAGLVDGIANYDAVVEMLRNDIQPKSNTSPEEEDVETDMKVQKIAAGAFANIDQTPAADAPTPGSQQSGNQTAVPAAQEPAPSTAPAAAPDGNGEPAPAEPPSDKPTPLFAVGDKCMISAPYSMNNGKMGEIVGEPKMTYVYSVRAEGAADGMTDTYAEDEMKKSETPTQMDAASAALVLDANARAEKAEATAKAASDRAAKLEAELLDNALVNAGADKARLTQYRTLVAPLVSSEPSIQAAVDKHKAENADWYVYGNKQAAAPAVVTQAEDLNAGGGEKADGQTGDKFSMSAPNVGQLEGQVNDNGVKAFGPRRRRS